MGVYIYKISDRKTGETLFTGWQSECGEYLGCGAKQILALALREPRAEKETKYSQYKVTRVWKDVVPVCVDCGLQMPYANPTRVRCPECAKRRKREQAKKYREQGRTGVRQYCDPVAAAREACRGCQYWGGERYENATCNYLFIVGRSRGCPPGEGCIRRKEKKK